MHQQFCPMLHLYHIYPKFTLFQGWGKAVPIPQNPVYVPPELLKLNAPPSKSGLPFNGQMHESDIKKGYIVPDPNPRPLPSGIEANVSLNADLKQAKNAYEEFIGVVERSTVRVILPTDRVILDRIHKTIEYVIREGPVFEAIIIARESKNPSYNFLYDIKCQEHIYYRWKLYSILHGDDPYLWRTDEFRMFEGGPIWRPPPLNPYAEGMPEVLIEKSLEDLPLTDKTTTTSLNKPSFMEIANFNLSLIESRSRGELGEVKRELLGDLLRNLDPTKVKIAHSMMFCISHSGAAKEIINCIYESLRLLETPFQKKIARLYLVSDILHNCSASVTNASYYREGFQAKLLSIFEHLREYLINIEDRYKADKFKQKVLSVLGAWKEWTLYEDEFIIKLSNILLGINKKQLEPEESQQKALQSAKDNSTMSHLLEIIGTDSELKTQRTEEDLDGEELDDKSLGDCLEAKGLSLRWYKTLELSDDEEEDTQSDGCSGEEKCSPRTTPPSARSGSTTNKDGGGSLDKIRFKASKWETVDLNQDPVDLVEGDSTR